MIDNPRPTHKVNSAWDAHFYTDWDNKFNTILHQSPYINSTGDAALYESLRSEYTSIPSFGEINSNSDIKIHNEHQKLYRFLERTRVVRKPRCKTYYNSIDEAAIDFVLQYNKISISLWCEYDTCIDSVDVNGVTMYTLGEAKISPKRCDENGRPKYEGDGAELDFTENTVAYVHTHAQYYDTLNDVFSQADLNIANNHSVYAYVGVPIGDILKYNSQSGEISTISNEAPFDMNHPNWTIR